MRFKLFEASLTEGSHYSSQAVDLLANSGLFEAEYAVEEAECVIEKIKKYIHLTNPAWLEKYILGIVRLFIEYTKSNLTTLDHFLNKYADIFSDYFAKYVCKKRETMSDTEKKKFDDEFRFVTTIKDIKNTLDEIQSQQDTQAEQELSKKHYTGASTYNLIPCESFEELNSKFGGDEKTGVKSELDINAWCHANNREFYNHYINDGKNMIFVLANKHWEDIKYNHESSSKNPKDEYGTSLIALVVDKKSGKLRNATLRCNHVNIHGNVDHQYTNYLELSDIAGFNVKQRVAEYLSMKGYLRTGEQKPVDWDNFDGSRESLLKILNDANVDIEDLTEAEIRRHVTEIGARAFEGCTNLRNVIMYNGTRIIHSDAFSGCTNLSIGIADSVSKIASDAFDDCWKLTIYCRSGSYGEQFALRHGYHVLAVRNKINQ